MNVALEVFGISVKEVARILGVSVSHVYRLGATDETFPKPRMVGGARRYDPREIRTWFDAQRVEGRAVRSAAGKKRLRVA
jgi:predicted DNA-binding transcriptional regulator AlpA